jgi:hypothetical protein
MTSSKRGLPDWPLALVQSFPDLGGAPENRTDAQCCHN